MTPRRPSDGRATTPYFLFLGLLFLTGGMLFLYAASQAAGLMPLALALLLLGGTLVAWAGVRWRRMQRIAAQALAERISALAAGHDAVVTLPLVMRELRVSEQAARAALSHAEASGLCRQEPRADRIMYVFSDCPSD